MNGLELGLVLFTQFAVLLTGFVQDGLQLVDLLRSEFEPASQLGANRPQIQMYSKSLQIIARQNL